MLWLAVALGGALGAVARYGFALWIPVAPGRFPLATFSVNIIGSVLIGFFYVLIVEKGLLTPATRHLLVVGFLGAFTTFSTFSLEAVQLLQAGQGNIALAYVAASFILSIGAAWLGLSVASKII